MGDFNPRTPGGVRLQILTIKFAGRDISIHAPRVGCDCNGFFYNILCKNFNPRTPGGVRPQKMHYCAMRPNNFNPRTPGGVRRIRVTRLSTAYNFNPRTPGGVRPRLKLRRFMFYKISIHAPRVGCDSWRLNSLHSPS